MCFFAGGANKSGYSEITHFDFTIHDKDEIALICSVAAEGMFGQASGTGKLSGFHGSDILKQNKIWAFI